MLAVASSALAFAGASPVAIRAQEPPPAPAAIPADTLSSGPSPAGAFLRGALIPGWGHTVSGSLTRGAFYFGVESASVWMLFKTIQKLGAVRDRVDFWETRVTERLVADGVTDRAEIATALDMDPDVIRTRNLAEGREEQREDWLAVSIFFLLVSGVDAFVSAHLQDFPEPLTIEGDPSDGRVEVGIRIPVNLPGGS